MSLATLVLELLLASVAAIALRRGRDWAFVAVMAAGAIGSIFSIGQFAMTQRIWWFSLWDVLLAPATAAVTVAAFPWLLPGGVRRLMLSPEVKLDRDLVSILGELGDILGSRPPSDDAHAVESWAANAVPQGTQVLRRLEGMVAPTPEWSDLLRAYIALTRRTVAAIPSGVTAEQYQALQAEGDDLSLRLEGLRPRKPVSSR